MLFADFAGATFNFMIVLGMIAAMMAVVAMQAASAAAKAVKSNPLGVASVALKLLKK